MSITRQGKAGRSILSDSWSYRVFGWTAKNEISNGRWVMMGLAIGMLTEQATGVNFIDQIKLTLSYMGVVELD